MRPSFFIFITFTMAHLLSPSLEAQMLPWISSACDTATHILVNRYGEAQRTHIERGLQQVARFWREEDGTATTFLDFVQKYYAGTPEEHDTLYARCEHALEPLYGHMEEIARKLREHLELDRGPITPIDELFGAYAPNAHIIDDFFKNKIAFVVLLNFPLTTLEERLQQGHTWSRKQWAEVRLAQIFSSRVPAAVYQNIAHAASVADQYISEYNIFMHHILTPDGRRLFPKEMKLLSHWNLRDELKAQYAGKEEGLEKQRIIQKIMERIVTQTIPAIVPNNPSVDWEPFSNTVTPAPESETRQQPPVNVSAEREPDVRYEMLRTTFLAARQLDPYFPTASTHMARRFDEEREIPESRVREILLSVLSSPLVSKVAQLIEHRLKRPLEPFDIWYNGFKEHTLDEQQLDAIVQQKYPTADAFAADIPRILTTLGFPPQDAQTIASLIRVEPARGAGHASGALMRGTHARLRTRIGPNGMNYKGYNIAIHELGHTVEQTLSLNAIDYYFLNGVPNIAFTEAVAFLFQSQDKALLGFTNNSKRSNALKTLNDFWATYEIAGVALVDMDVWQWMYAHPQATAAELKEATLTIAKNIWNTYYAPHFHHRDVTLLAIYSHMIDGFLYIPDYPLGHIIAHQIEQYARRENSIGQAIKKMVTLGRLTPEVWLRQATSQPLSAEALLDATHNALVILESEK